VMSAERYGKFYGPPGASRHEASSPRHLAMAASSPRHLSVPTPLPARKNIYAKPMGPEVLPFGGVTPVQACAAMQKERTLSGGCSLQFLPLHHPPGLPAVKVSATAMNVQRAAADLLARCKEVAFKIPHAPPQRFERVSMALDADRAIAILAKKLEGAPSVCDVVLWIEHAEPQSPTPNFLARPARGGFPCGLDPEFEAQLRRDFARARAEIHARHAVLVKPLVEQAEAVAARIPNNAADRERRCRIAGEAVSRMQKQLDLCYFGEQEARREFF